MKRVHPRHRRTSAVLVGLLAAVFSLVFALVGPSSATATGGGTQTVQLHLLDLTCLTENDSFGSDEPYIKVNGVRIWSGSNVDRGDIELVNYWYPFDEVVTVELWEDDGSWTGSDDHMATWHFWAGEVGTGIQSVNSQYTAGYYRLRYEVV